MSSDGKAPSDSGLGTSCGRPDSRALEDQVGADDENEFMTNEPTTPGTPIAQHVTTPPPHISSPSIPSPMSWGKLDLFTPLGQHLAASLNRSSEEPLVDTVPRGRSGSDVASLGHGARGDSSESDELIQDCRDILVRRLTNLAKKLSAGERIPDQATLDLLHGRVDDMDRAVSGQETDLPQKNTHSAILQSSSRGSLQRVNSREESGWSSPSSSWMRSRYSDLSLSTRREQLSEKAPAAVRKPAVDSFKIASEAEKVSAELETLLTNLQARQEESEHIHELLVTRAERAAQRIIFLQSRVQLLESELQESDADLSHLRLGLKAIEVQCPRELLSRDTELAQSIAIWKRDYADLKQRRAARRRRAFAEESSLVDQGHRDLNTADCSVSSETTAELSSSVPSTPSRPPRRTVPSMNLTDSSAFETPSPHEYPGRRAQCVSRLTSPDLKGHGAPTPGDENDSTLTPSSARSRSTATPARDRALGLAREEPRPSTTSSKALRRIIMSATPPRQSRPLHHRASLSFGPPLERSDTARAAVGRRPLRSYDSFH